MDELSALLRIRREEKGVSLPDASAATRIPLHYLEIIEGAGEARFLSDEVYLIPFLRRYAAFLDLDPSDVSARFVGGLAKGQRMHPAKGPLRQPASFSRRTVFVSILLGLILLGYLLWQSGTVSLFSDKGEKAPIGPLPSEPAERGGGGPHGSTPEPTVSVPAPEHGDDAVSPGGEPEFGLPVAPERAAPVVAEPEPAGVESAPPQPPAVSAEPTADHRLAIRADEETWVRAVIDGDEQKDVLLKPGDVVVWSAKEGFVLTLGNAGGVKLTFDDRELPAAGASGKVLRDIRLPGPLSERRGG